MDEVEADVVVVVVLAFASVSELPELVSFVDDVVAVELTSELGVLIFVLLVG